MKNSLKLVPKQRQKMQLRKKLLLVAGATTIVVLTIAAIFFINLTDVKDSKASQMARIKTSGFENGITDWKQAGYGSWEAISDPEKFRSGKKAAQLTTVGNKEGILKNTEYIIEVPAHGKNYITVIAYAKASHCKNEVAVGIENLADGTQKRSEAIIADTVWRAVSATFEVSNGEKYFPVLYARRENGGPMIHINYDDVVIFCSTANSKDLSVPGKPGSPSVKAFGTKVNLSWKPGTNAGSGMDGSMVLRASGIVNSSPTVNLQSVYTSGEILNKEWKVVYNGTSINAYTDVTESAATYTYLIYNRDLAYNYSSPLRIVSSDNPAAVFTAQKNSKDDLIEVTKNTVNIPSGSALIKDFTAQKGLNNTIHLSWTTNNEGKENNISFEIERSTDETEWLKIAEINGKENSDKIQKYNYSDNLNISSQNTYYRLKLLYVTGKHEYTKTLKVIPEVAILANGNLKAWYSNPDNKIFATFENSSARMLSALMVNISGQIVGKQAVPSQTGMTKINFDMNGLSNGIYTIILEGGEKTRALKVVKNW